MRRLIMQRRCAWLLAMLALVCGAPLYLALGHAHLLPLAFRDRPWPIETFSFLASLAAGVLAFRAGSRKALTAAILALTASVGLSAFARAVHLRLPPPEPAFHLGQAPPPVELTDDAGRRFTFASLRGSPAVLIFFRGAS